ncbi:MAG: pyridoxal phosphate-dependent decarboxylase family protein [Flammeovirgaceae bacterium]
MTEIQKKMFAEMAEQSIYDRALGFGKAYLDDVLQRHVSPTEEAIQNLSFFDEEMNESYFDSHQLINDLHQYGAPATSAIMGGRYFGFVNGSVVPAATAAKVMSTFWDQNTAMYVISPVASKLESVVEKWLLSILNFPTQAVAGFVSGSSMANFCGLAAGRYRLLQNQNWDVNKRGLFNAPSLRVVTGREAHSTVLKSIGLLGFGQDTIEFVDTDLQGRIRAELLPPLDNRTLVILQAGNVNSGSFDEFESICTKARAAGAWVHIDGAFGLWASAVKNLSHLTKGMELANSWAVDGHKTLNTPYDSGIVLCADKEALTSALHMAGAYIVVSKDRDGMFYTPEMSRRARIIELWATLKYLGKRGVDEMIEEMHVRAKQFAQELSSKEGFTILNDVVFNQVLVCCASDTLTNKVIEHIQRERVCWVGGSTWRGKKVIRISVCSWATTAKDVSMSVASFQSSLQKAQSEFS